MIRDTGKNGKEYILRFDMTAIAGIREEFGEYTAGLKKLTTGDDIDAVTKIFAILANAGAEYLAEEQGLPEPEKITGEGLLTKHSSFGRLKGIMKAIDEAIRDGNRMMSAEEEDEEIRDGYLKELNESGKN